MVASRRARGFRTEEIVAADLAATIFPSAHAATRGAPGRDILKTPPFAVEVKARHGFQPLAWLRQALKNAHGDRPVVVIRPDGTGEKTLDQWLVLMPYSAWKTLVREAGHGYPQDS